MAQTVFPPYLLSDIDGAWDRLPTELKITLTHWGRVTHICINRLTIIGSDNGLLPGRRQAIIWTNAGILLIGPLGTNFSEICIGIQTFSLKKIHLKMSSAKWRLFCLGLNVLKHTEASVKWAPLCGLHFKCIVWLKTFVFGFDFYWRLFLLTQSTPRQHWFR